MKRTIKNMVAMMMALVMVLGLVSCGNTSDETTSNTPNPIPSDVVDTEATPESSEVGTEDETEEPKVEESKGTKDESMEETPKVETTSEPTETEKPTETGKPVETTKPTETTKPIEHVHNYGEPKITTPATCDANGVRTYTCTDPKCGYSYTESIKATGHNYDSGKVVKESTCSDAGSKLFTCVKCGIIYTEAIPANGNHQWETVHIPGSGHYETGGTHRVMFTKCNCGFTVNSDMPNVNDLWSEHRTQCRLNSIFWYEDVPNSEPVYVVDYPDRDITYCPLCGTEK